jgi:energy-coupling factor transporter ATP-binding protein EcfA2
VVRFAAKIHTLIINQLRRNNSNILTGINNAGKTTVLEALALWHECFTKLIRQAGKKEKNYDKGQWVLGNTQVKYFPFEQINSVRCPNFEDLFHQRDRRKRIALSANLENNDGQVINICFWISESGMNYKIELDAFTSYDFKSFNAFFNNFPIPIGFFYASPISAIQQIEAFSTQPQINDAIINRASASVLRNRLYTLYRNPNPALFQKFLDDVSFVLFNNRQRIELSTTSDIQLDTNIVFNVKTHPGDVPKDIALLGSGSIQILEILLNLFQSDSQNKDMNLILLDEPDSHIHRDIQSRLLQVLNNFSKGSQIFITTHNEALIRGAQISHLFHLEPKAQSVYKNLDAKPLQKVQPRFSGIYPAATKPLISAIGQANALDFINAVESDVLLFVEGEDDARAFDILLRQQIHSKKYAYWVLGGVSKVFDNILHYKTVLSNIKNQKSLWDKAVLIIDRDFLNDQHQSTLAAELQSKIGLKTRLTDSYTFETTLLTDIPKCAQLISKWLSAKDVEYSNVLIESALIQAYEGLAKAKTPDWNETKFIEEMAYLYRNVREKLNVTFGEKSKEKYIKENDIQLGSLVRNHIQTCLNQGAYYKLMRKDDLQFIINESIAATGIVFDVETDFIELMLCVDKSLWFDSWDFLNTF